MQRLLTLDLNLLVALAILLEEGSVTGAARRLGITQSAVSHKLKRLREQLDDPLLVPGTRGLVPTERALALAQPLRDALEQLAATVAGDQPFDPATASHEFVLSGADLFEFVGLPQVLEFVAAEAPKLSLIVISRQLDVFDRMERGEIHVAFGPRFPERAGLRQLKLFDEPFVVIGRAEHPLLRRKLSLDAYLRAEHLLISPQGRPGGFVDDALARLGKSRRVAVQVGHFATAPFLVARSDLLLTAPVSLAREAAKHLALRQRPVPLELPPAPALMAWHERFDREPAHRWFRTALHRHIVDRSRC